MPSCNVSFCTCELCSRSRKLPLKRRRRSVEWSPSHSSFRLLPSGAAKDISRIVRELLIISAVYHWGEFFLLWNAHFGTQSRVPRLLWGEAPRKRGPGGSKNAREAIGLCTRLRIATWNCAGLSKLTMTSCP